jgi:hypothetical protein
LSASLKDTAGASKVKLSITVPKTEVTSTRTVLVPDPGIEAPHCKVVAEDQEVVSHAVLPIIAVGEAE